MSEENKTPLLEVKNLKKWFPAKSSAFSREKAFIKAVDGVSFTLNAGETLGVVGESGCGKSTMGRSVLRLLEPTSGQVLFEGKDYTALKSADLRKSRTDLQIIFQDPYASLDPRMTIGDIIGEPLDIQLKLPAKERMQRVLKSMERVGHVVELANKEYLYKRTMHPYTTALLSAIPVPDRKHKKEKIVLEGDLPSPANPPAGCVFHTRCYKAQEICKTQVPELRDCGNGHCCACHFPEQPQA